MDKGKKGFMRRVLAGVVSVCVLLSNVNITAFAAEPNNVSPDSFVTEADPSTMDNWKDYFADGVNGDKAISTEFAGGVWTDKSVFTRSQAEAVSEFVNVNVDNIGEDNFLIALSALASNKEIKGYSTIPTDTVLVLDLSQSMDTSQSIPDMVNAANSAIAKLLDLNKNNRVGVILYSGNTSFGSSNTDTGIELLPLGRYTANGNGQFLAYSSYRFNESDRNGTRVSIATGVQTEAKENVTINSKITQGGTYIQNGLYKAYQMFEAVADTTVSTEEGNNVQEGVKRMPIMVLMSDGAPTAGTTSYNNVGTSNAGNGGRSTAGLGFLTQLTASWAREKIESKYDNEMKFYSLGLDLTRDSDTTAQSVAASVLDPVNSMSSIDSAWTSFITNGSVSVSVPNSTENGTDNGNKTVTVSKDNTIFNNSEKDYQTYIDRYFEADSNAELNAAFADIVDEIILQSAYYPTLVSSGEHDLDGYVTFEDELGQFMEVKNMTGLLIGDTLYSGEALAQMMGTGAFGNRYEWTELGWELVYTVAERIGVDEQTAISLLMSAWADGQLSYDETTDAYSNYIGWYEGENGQYIAYWNENHTEEEVAAEVANGAKYITKSYGFYGPTDEESSIAGRNMMHVVIKVRTEIATKHQDVVYQIPASLIPTVTYEITLNSSSLETATEIEIDRNAQEPLRLLFEVGLRSDINELNVDEVMSNLGKGQHVHKNADGTYYFYSNQWGDGRDADFDYTDPTTHLTTESYFEPSVENERYYYVTDTVICVDQEGTKYEGSTAPSGTGYYHGRTYFVATGNGNQAEVATTYVPIAEATLKTENLQQQGDYWYVKAGNVFQETARFQTEKTENTTETLRYSDYPLVSHPENASDKYEAYAFLGNNGRLTVTPATGIKLTKQVDETLADVDQEYTFKIKINTTEQIYTARLTRGAGEAESIQFEDGLAEVSIKAGETIYITELPTGEYTVDEVIKGDYKVASVSINGSEENRITAKGSIVSTDLEDIVFTNTENKVGSLIVRKTVTHDLPSDPEALADIEFTIQVELKDAAGVPLANQEYLDGSNNPIKTNEKGIAELTLTHGEAITITGLPGGATYTVTEPAMPAGFKLQTNASLAGTIVANASVVANVVNDYNPTSVPGGPIGINVTKKLDDVPWGSYSFTFHLDRMSADGTWEQIGESKTANEQNKTFSFAIPEYSLTTVGRHYFRVIEENPNTIPGITSDATRYFYIDVTDDDMDGELEIATIVGDNVVVENNVILMNFVNTYTTSGEATVNIPIEKFLNNNTGVDIGLDGFEFALYSGDDDTPVTGTLVKTNAVGEATIKLTYDAETFKELDESDGQTDNEYVLKYTLREVPGVEAGIRYSEEKYTVTITLTSVGGALSASTVISKDNQTVTEAGFTNTFTLETYDDLEISVAKKLEGRTLNSKEFTFNLYETGADFYVAENATVKETAQNGEGNNAVDKVVFDDITYDKVGSYYYVIREDATNPLGGVTYSKEVYYVTVKVGNNGDVPFVERVTYVKPGSGTINADQVVFTNTYEAEPTGAVIEGTKSLSGKTLEHGMFEFELYDYTGNTQSARIDTAENTLDGKFTFDEIKYTAAGTYEYLVVEKDLDELGYTYDDAQYKVTIEVKDNGLGNLVAQAPDIQEIGGNGTTLAFENSYKPLALTNLAMTIKKTLRNRMIEANEFSFEVYAVDSTFMIDEEQDPLQTVQNDGEGKVVFKNQSDTDKTFYFEEIGTHYFVIKEVIPGNAEPHIAYDNREYQVTVLVYDQGGRLSAHVTYALNGQEVTDPAFENVYIPSPEKEVYKKEDVQTSIDGKIVEAGEVLTYKISYMNPSKSAVDVTITDTIPAGTTYVADSATEVGVVEYKDGQLIWIIEDVKPGSTVTVSFDVEVNGEEVDIYNTGYIQVGEHVYKTNEVYNSLFDKEMHENNPENPTDPDEPKKSEEYVSTVTPVASPKTSDNASTALWSTLALGSLMICGALLVIEKKRGNEI